MLRNRIFGSYWDGAAVCPFTCSRGTTRFPRPRPPKRPVPKRGLYQSTKSSIRSRRRRFQMPSSSLKKCYFERTGMTEITKKASDIQNTIRIMLFYLKSANIKQPYFWFVLGWEAWRLVTCERGGRSAFTHDPTPAPPKRPIPKRGLYNFFILNKKRQFWT